MHYVYLKSTGEYLGFVNDVSEISNPSTMDSTETIAPEYNWENGEQLYWTGSEWEIR